MSSARRSPTRNDDAAIVTVEKLRQVGDVRGFVYEPLDDVGLAQQRNVHVVLTQPGHIRGNHFHRIGHEVSTVVGPAHVRYRERDALVDHHVPEKEAWRFTFPPQVTHAFQNTGERELLIVSFNTRAHDPADADTQRDVIL